MYSVKLINRALRALGESPIDEIDENDLDEQPNRVIKLLGEYDTAIGATLKAIGRGEFIRHITLSPLLADGDWKFPYRFQLPDDGLAFLDPVDCVDIEMAIEPVNGIDQAVVRASSDAALDLSYVRRVNPDLLGPEVFEALGLNLAAACAYQITASRDISARVEDKAAKAILLAKGATRASTEDTPRRHNRMAGVRGAWRR